MGEVGVHLEDALGAPGESLAEPGEVRRGEALLAGPVQDADVRHLARELVRQLAGAVRRVVVDDQRVQLHAVTVGHLADAAQGVAQVLALVVRGEDDDVHGREYISPRHGAPSAPSGSLRGVGEKGLELCRRARTCTLR